MPETSKKSAVWAWVLYDFANTVFSVSILTVFFPLWVDQQIGHGAWLVNLATAVSALLVFFTVPALGAMADLRQRRVPYLVVLTVISVFLTASLDLARGEERMAVSGKYLEFTRPTRLVFTQRSEPVPEAEAV